MGLGPLVAIFLRLILPLTIFRWPLGGAILSIIVDTVDVVIVGIINQGDFPDYAAIDKMLDMYYLTFLLLVSLKWKDLLARKTSIFLFAYRFCGFLLFEVTKIRLFLFLFPNLFLDFYLFFAVWKKITKKPKLTARKLLIILIILLIPKMAQEYMLHFLEFKPWHWFHTEILKVP